MCDTRRRIVRPLANHEIPKPSERKMISIRKRSDDFSPSQEAAKVQYCRYPRSPHRRKQTPESVLRQARSIARLAVILQGYSPFHNQISDILLFCSPSANVTNHFRSAPNNCTGAQVRQSLHFLRDLAIYTYI